MGKRTSLWLAFVGLSACTGGSLADKSHPATGGSVVPVGGNVAADAAVVSDATTSGDAVAVDAQRPDTKVDPLNAAATCTSKASWSSGYSQNMAPGFACISCHKSSGEGPLYTVAGTLYPTGHEPDACNGASGTASGAKIVLTGAGGKVLTLTPNSVGNFFSVEQVAMPYTVKVVNGNGIERIMVSSATTGDCNSCHTQNGSDGAPGRVTLP